ncbi:MAG: SDR family NAD(P)-dependent oxidoreductase [Actinomycetes bacterium]
MVEGRSRRQRRRRLAGQIVVVTGAGVGIGRCTAIQLARAGATVVVAARDEGCLRELAAEQHGVIPHAADLTEDDARVGLVDRTLAEFGQIDVLVNNLGVGWTGPFEHMDLAQLRRLTETNLVAPMDMTRLVLDGMLARHAGDVVLVASAGSWFSMPPLTAYCATKYGVEGFAEGLRREVLNRGVRVHSIHPGPVRTQFAARSAGEVPGDIAGPPRPGPGVDPRYVAAAIERVLTRPGAHMVTVPRVLGVTRLVKLPPLQQAADRVVGLMGARLARSGRRLAKRAAGPFAV